MITLDHINIPCDDQEAVRDFFVNVVGLVEGYRPPFEFPGYWLYLGDTPVIHLQSTDRSPKEAKRGWVDHIAFGGFEFEATRDRVAQTGYEFKTQAVPGVGFRQVFVTGPEGVKVELQCPGEG